jgi:hypothetical protein
MFTAIDNVFRVIWIDVLSILVGGLPMSRRKLVLPHSGYLHTSRNATQSYNVVIQNTAIQ